MEQRDEITRNGAEPPERNRSAFLGDGAAALSGGAEENRLPNEIVETYRQTGTQTGTRERVFFYRRPMPKREQPQSKALLPPRHTAPQPVEAPKVLRRRRRRGLRRFLACFVLLAALAGVSLAVERRPMPNIPRFSLPFPHDEDTFLENREITIPAAPTGLGASVTVEGSHDRALTAQEIYRQVNPSVVLVMTQLSDGGAIGTGVIFTGDGYIVTNYHVLEGGEDCQVILDTGEFYEARYVGGDADSDLAVLKIDGRNLPAARFGDSDTLTVGDRVYAIGNPLGVELRGTMTDGIVSAIDRDVWVDHRTMTLIQTNAALNSGNSGGPLINEYGQVVGINVIKMSADYSDVTVEGLGFAIPTASMERIVNDLLGWGEVQPEPVLGVTVRQQGTELAGGRWGLEVLEVTADSAAGRAGIREGDYVLRAAGEDLRTSRDLLRVRRRCHLGDRLEVQIWREGRTLELVLELTDAVEPETETAPWYVE